MTQWQIYLQCCVTVTAIQFQNQFSIPNRKPVPVKHALFPYLLVTSILLSLNCPLRVPHRSGIIRYSAFCVGLISLSIVSPRLIHFVEYNTASFLFKAESFHCL